MQTKHRNGILDLLPSYMSDCKELSFCFPSCCISNKVNLPILIFFFERGWHQHKMLSLRKQIAVALKPEHGMKKKKKINITAMCRSMNPTVHPFLYLACSVGKNANYTLNWSPASHRVHGERQPLILPFTSSLSGDKVPAPKSGGWTTIPSVNRICRC